MSSYHIMRVRGSHTSWLKEWSPNFEWVESKGEAAEMLREQAEKLVETYPYPCKIVEAGGTRPSPKRRRKQ